MAASTLPKNSFCDLSSLIQRHDDDDIVVPVDVDDVVAVADEAHADAGADGIGFRSVFRYQFAKP